MAIWNWGTLVHQQLWLLMEFTAFSDLQGRTIKVIQKVIDITKEKLAQMNCEVHAAEDSLRSPAEQFTTNVARFKLGDNKACTLLKAVPVSKQALKRPTIKPMRRPFIRAATESARFKQIAADKWECF